MSRNNLAIFFKKISITVIIGYSLSFSLLAKSGVDSPAIQRQLAVLETKINGRLGVVLMDSKNNLRVVYRGDERFPMCSTTKVMVVASILKRSELQSDLLNKHITYHKSDLVNYNPITEKNLDKGMTISQLSAAALQYSDNTATNLLINTLGGTQYVTDFARSIGDIRYRLDRLEPELNHVIPGNHRDTTTPLAMAESLRKLVLGNVLLPLQRAQLINWMKGNTTGNTSIRAGLPTSWLIGDRTGVCDYGTTNDIAVIWPPNTTPMVLTVYFTQYKKDAIPRQAILAYVAKLVTQA